MPESPSVTRPGEPVQARRSRRTTHWHQLPGSAEGLVAVVCGSHAGHLRGFPSMTCVRDISVLCSWKSWNVQGRRGCGEGSLVSVLSACRGHVLSGEPCGPQGVGLGDVCLEHIMDRALQASRQHRAGRVMPRGYWTSACRSGKCMYVDWNELTYVTTLGEAQSWELWALVSSSVK